MSCAVPHCRLDHGTKDRKVGHTKSDGVALRAFEQLVQAQQPATQPWQPVTDYSFEARRQIEGEHPRLIKDVFQPAHVLDYGCGPGHLVSLLRWEGIDADGYEPNPAWREKAEPNARPHMSCATERWALNHRDYDLVICREVLEHCTIRQMKDVIWDLCRLAGQYIYVTTRFAKDPQHLLDVDTSDDLDPTHVSMLNPTLLRLLFVLEGFKRRADLETAMDWQHKRRVLVYERV